MPDQAISESSNRQRVAVAGATGYIGGRLAPRLLDSGYSIRCLVRSPAKLQGREWAEDSRAEVRQADLTDADSLARNLKGCQAAFYLVHSMTSAGAKYAEQDRRLASVFASAARQAGVERIIYLGGLGETGPDLSQHLSSRREVEAGLASTGVPVTVLRAAMIIGSGSASFEILRYLVHLITPLSHHIAKPLAEGLKNPVVCRENRITKLIPQELLTVREAIRAALRKVTENQVETNWSMAGPIPSDPDWAGGTVFRDERDIVVEVPDWAVFRAVCRVGGGHGWYAADWLWRLRGWIDLVVGGPGLRRGRRDPEMVRYGEALDFWRVVGVERDRRLVLRAE